MLSVAFVLLLAQVDTGSEPPAKDWERPARNLLSNPLESRELARAKFAATRGSVPDLAKSRLETVKTEYEARFIEFAAGRGTPQFLSESLSHKLEAELAVAGPGAARLPILEPYWAQRAIIARIDKARFESGRIDYKTYEESLYYLLEAEGWFSDPWIKNKEGRTHGCLPGPDPLQLANLRLPGVPDRFVSSPGYCFEQVHPLDSDDWKDLARAKREAVQAKCTERAQGMLEAARDIHERRLLNLICGRGTLHFVLIGGLRVLEAELRVSKNEDDRTAAIEKCWAYTQQLAELEQLLFAAGRIPEQDLAQTRSFLREAEQRLIEARGRGGKVGNWIPLPYTDYRGNGLVPLNTRPVARAKSEASLADANEKEQARLEEARREYQGREHEFLSGRGTLDFLINSLERLREADLNLCTTQADRIAALERYWARTWMIDLICRGRFLDGRIPLQDYAQTQYFRLDAQIRWAQARSESGKN